MPNQTAQNLFKFLNKLYNGTNLASIDISCVDISTRDSANNYVYIPLSGANESHLYLKINNPSAQYLIFKDKDDNIVNVADIISEWEYFKSNIDKFVLVTYGSDNYLTCTNTNTNHTIFIPVFKSGDSNLIYLDTNQVSNNEITLFDSYELDVASNAVGLNNLLNGLRTVGFSDSVSVGFASSVNASYTDPIVPNIISYTDDLASITQNYVFISNNSLYLSNIVQILGGAVVSVDVLTSVSTTSEYPTSNIVGYVVNFSNNDGSNKFLLLDTQYQIIVNKNSFQDDIYTGLYIGVTRILNTEDTSFATNSATFTYDLPSVLTTYASNLYSLISVATGNLKKGANTELETTQTQSYTYGDSLKYISVDVCPDTVFNSDDKIDVLDIFDISKDHITINTVQPLVASVSVNNTAWSLLRRLVDSRNSEDKYANLDVIKINLLNRVEFTYDDVDQTKSTTHILYI